MVSCVVTKITYLYLYYDAQENLYIFLYGMEKSKLLELIERYPLDTQILIWNTEKWSTMAVPIVWIKEVEDWIILNGEFSKF